MSRRVEKPLEGQCRINLWTGAIIEPPEPRVISGRCDLGELKQTNDTPSCAYINTEGLMIIRNRINENKMVFSGSNEELANKLVVFMGGRTKIHLDPTEEFKKGYEIRLNIGIIAWKTPATDDQDIPVGHDFYQFLGVYKEYKATGKVSTDKSTRKFATIQKSNKNHPENIYVGEYFFAKPQDAIMVRKSSSTIERTGYYWGKK